MWKEFGDQILRLPIEAPWLVIVFAAMLGMMVGSFANVLIYRLPRYCLSIVKPASHCPKCETPIKWYDNIPFFAWALWLGRKCRACKTPIPWMYPAVELFVGSLFALFAWQVLVAPEMLIFGKSYFELAGNSPQDWLLMQTGSSRATAIEGLRLDWQHFLLFGLWSAASVALLVASWIDAQMRIIPDSISLGGTVAVLLMAPLVPVLHYWGVPGTLVLDPFFYTGSLPLWANAWATTATLMFGAALALYLLGHLGALLAPKEAKAAGGGMGFGDVKLIMLLAGLLGWPKLVVAFCIAVLAGAIIGMPTLYKKLKGVEGTRTEIPFGPYLAFGTVTAMLFSDEIFGLVEWYVETLLAP